MRVLKVILLYLLICLSGLGYDRLSQEARSQELKQPLEENPFKLAWETQMEGAITSAAISPSGQSVAVSYENGGVKLLDKQKSEIGAFSANQECSALAFCDDHTIAFNSGYRSVVVYDTAKETLLGQYDIEFATGGSASLPVLACAGKNLIVGDGGGYLRAIVVGSGERWKKYTGGHVVEVSITGDNKIFHLSILTTGISQGEKEYAAAFYNQDGSVIANADILTRSFHSYLTRKAAALPRECGAIVYQEPHLALYDCKLEKPKLISVDGWIDSIGVSQEMLAYSNQSKIFLLDYNGIRLGELKVRGSVDTLAFSSRGTDLIIGTKAGILYYFTHGKS